VFSLLLILLITGVTLGVLLFVGGLFVQGYIYTQPSPFLKWGAPAAAAALFVFYALWCVTVALSAPADSPYHVVWQFSTRSDQFPAPVKDLWAIHKGGKTDHYVLKKGVMFRGQARASYHNPDTDSPWRGTGVEEIVIRDKDKQEFHYVLSTLDDQKREDDKKRQRGAYREFVSSDGWVIKETESGPSDNPQKSRIGRFFLFALLHMLHLGLWFACLWLLMRFQWGHALAGAFVLWLAITMLTLPMLVGYAAEISYARHTLAAPAAP
jgi:hypothetical protein